MLSLQHLAATLPDRYGLAPESISRPAFSVFRLELDVTGNALGCFCLFLTNRLHQTNSTLLGLYGYGPDDALFTQAALGQLSSCKSTASCFFLCGGNFRYMIRYRCVSIALELGTQCCQVALLVAIGNFLPFCGCSLVVSNEFCDAFF